MKTAVRKKAPQRFPEERGMHLDFRVEGNVVYAVWCKGMWTQIDRRRDQRLVCLACGGDITDRIKKWARHYARTV